LEELIRQRKAFSAQPWICPRRQGVAAAASLIATGRGQEIMNRIGSVIGAMGHEEQDLLAQREARSQAVTSKTFLMLAPGDFHRSQCPASGALLPER